MADAHATFPGFYPLRMNPTGPVQNTSSHKIIPNNNPADVDFECASTGVQTTGAVIENNTYTNPKYVPYVEVPHRPPFQSKHYPSLRAAKRQTALH